MTEIHPKLKKLIAKYLIRDLHRVEIIYYRDSIWFIDRENRYWYFEYHKVDKHLWWRWSHFTQALKMFSIDGEKEQSIFGELVNMILNKKQNLETKYPDKVFKTVGSILNFKEDVKEVLNNQVNTTYPGFIDGHCQVEEVLNNQVKTTNFFDFTKIIEMEEVLNFEVETTAEAMVCSRMEVEEVLNCEVKKTLSGGAKKSMEAHKVLDQEVKTASAQKLIKEGMVEEVLNCEVKTTNRVRQRRYEIVDKILNHEVETTGFEVLSLNATVEEVLNHNVETIGEAYINDNYVTEEILNNTINTYDSGELVDEEKLINNVLNYGTDTIEINSIERMNGESPFQDIVVSHILDESEKVTDKLKIKEDDRVKSYSCDVFMCDFLVQNVLDIGSNSINFDVTSQQGRVDGVLKNS
jgi:hypothetical protein